MAFAICWLPIHLLELMKCANASLLHELIQLYPKVLYSFRAFTHALAYFNSCLNPYLYALLNRNFCLDLVDVIPSWRPCCKQSAIIEIGHSHGSAGVSSESSNHPKKSRQHHEDDDEPTTPALESTTNPTDGRMALLPLTTNTHDVSMTCHSKLI